jgi:hypothetical protein
MRVRKIVHIDMDAFMHQWSSGIISCVVHCFIDFVLTAVVTFVRFLVSFPSSQNHRPTPTLETFPGLHGIDGGVCFDRAQCDLERFLAQSWR